MTFRMHSSLRFLNVAASLAIASLAVADGAEAQGSAPAPKTCSAGASAAVDRLFVLSEARENNDRVIASMLKAQSETPGMPPAVVNVMREFLGEELAWSKMEPDMKRVYCETYTEADMRTLITLYESPAGQLLVKKLPEFMQRSQDVTQARMKDATPRLMQRMQAAMSGGGAVRDTTNVPKR